MPITKALTTVASVIEAFIHVSLNHTNTVINTHIPTDIMDLYGHLIIPFHLSLMQPRFMFIFDLLF
jgi:hypothetical protein